MNYLDLLEQVRAHVSGLFLTNNDKRLIYHNLEHTEQVVGAAVRLCGYYRLSDEDFFIVNTAAWFHDTGYLTAVAGHEALGAERAREFLAGKEVPAQVINAVSSCIMATTMPQKPVNLNEQIVCDADLFHLGEVSFRERNKLMRKEAEAFSGTAIDKDDWKIKTISLMEGHQFQTSYGKEHQQPGKAKNLQELRQRMEMSRNSFVNAVGQGSGPEAEVVGTHSGKIRKKNQDRPDKGIETMFRITSGNQQRLSDMADNKAHIMISTNSIILSVVLSLLLRKLEDNPHLIIPTLIMLIICVITMVFSILATRPSLPHGTFSVQDIREKKANLLFFGNFYRMPFSDYEVGMEAMMEDGDFLYGSLIRDLYAQGVVLGRKYHLLRMAYSVFMYGIVASVLAFMIAIAIVTL